MIDFVTIEATLNRLETEYNNSSADPQLPLFYSKLSVIEFCGWIEDSVDELLHNFIDAHILEPRNQTLIKRHIKSNHSFSYEDKMFPLISSVLGIDSWENILDSFPPADFVKFVAVLGNFSQHRNNLAHTHTVGTTPSYLAPSRVLGAYYDMKVGLQYLEREIQGL